MKNFVKKNWPFLVLGIVFLTSGIIFGNYLKLKHEKREAVFLASVPSISIKELKQKMDKGENFILIDARTEEEYKQSHIQGAISIPLPQINKKTTAKFSKNSEIIVYCYGAKCGTSVWMARKLNELGFMNVKKLDGSVKDWQAKGGPIEK